MSVTDQDILSILRHNQGFAEPRKWIQYAKTHKFNKVTAVRRQVCPGCGNTACKAIGQYVYYSQLVRIVTCARCYLVFSDVVTSKEVRRKHFDLAYKDDYYFAKLREPIFRHIANIIHSRFPGPRRVADIGGALGHLALMLTKRDVRYDITVTDISEPACKEAASRWGFNAICCPLEELQSHNVRFDIMLLIDVIYYVEDIKAAWQSINHCLEDNGVLVIRVPNKLWLIIIIQKFKNRFRADDMSDRVVGVNPEHLFFLSRKYLRNSLRAIGLNRISFRPSPPIGSERNIRRWFSSFFFILAVGIHFLSFGRVCITPSQILLARRAK